MFERYTIDYNSSIKDALFKMQINKIVYILIINPSNKVIGTLTQGDSIRAILNNHFAESSIKNIYNKNFIYINDRDLDTARKLIKINRISFIPILDKSFFLKDIIEIYDLV